MKVKKFILAIVVAISVSLGLLAVCASSEPNTEKKTYTVEEVSDIKKNLLEKFSKAITDSGLRIVESDPDNSFALSLGNLEKSKEQPKQVLNYSMTQDDKKGKEILDIQCVKDYSKDEKLIEGDKYVKAIYNIFKLLTDTELTEKKFFDEIEKIFNKGGGNVEIPKMKDINIQVNKIGTSIKSLELRFNKEFILE